MKITKLEDCPGWQVMNEGGLDKRAQNRDYFFGLSPSGCNDMASCSMKYKFSRIDKLPSKQSLPLVYGNAMHDGYEILMNQIMAGGKMDVGAVPETPIEDGYRTKKYRPFKEVWYSNEGSEWTDGKATKWLLDKEYNRLMTSFHGFKDKWEGIIHPVFTEPLLILPVPGGEDMDLHLVGYIDLGCIIDNDFHVMDYKSARELPKINDITGEYKVDAGYRQQLAAYAAAVWNWKLPNGEQKCGLLYTGKDDDPEHIRVDVTVNQLEVDAYARKLINYAKIIKQDLFTINRSYTLCSKKFCSFWDDCHEQFG